jgi:hypothetical protein
MAWIYSLKHHLLGIQGQSDAAREVFPIRVTRALYQTLKEDWGGSFSSLSSELQ